MNIDEELLQDAAHDAACVAYIQNHLPQELQEKFTEENLYYFIDLIVEYYAESGILDAAPDAEGYVEIDGEAIANYVVQKAKKEKVGDFDPEEIILVVGAQLDFEEEQGEA